MAHPPSVFIPNKNIKHTEYIQEKQGEQKCHREMFNENNVGPQNGQHDEIGNILPTETKCQVYVHHFKKIPSCYSNNLENNWRCGNETHQTMYKHEFSDYYAPVRKMQVVKKQFDNLSLNTRSMSNSPSRIPKHHSAYHQHPAFDYNNRSTKFPQVKSSPTARINKSFLFKPEHKAMADRLEESYWSKWKPNKLPVTKVPIHRTKGLYTENEKMSAHYSFSTHTNEKNERGDSSETIRASIASTKHDTTGNTIHTTCLPNHSNIHDQKLSNTSTDERFENSELDSEQEQIHTSETSIPISEQNSQNCNSLVPILLPKSDSESNVNVLKHTDSFILTIKKQSEEKSHYQQPKCIKLFKNLDYAPTAKTNYIKGGTYPLKSCLKRNNVEKQSSSLGPPGGSPRVTSKNRTRKPGKASRFTNY